ncbi:unnamed protein product [Calypogeia fissa]
MACVIRSGMLSPASRHNDEPGQALDYVTGGLILVCTIPFVIGNVVMVWFRDYPPIRSKSVVLTVMSSCGGLTYVAATMVSDENFSRPRKNTVWEKCPLWTFWVQAFGFSLWLACFVLRLLNLYLILIMKRGAIKYVKVALLVLLSPMIIFSVFASIYGGSRFVVRNNLNQSTVVGPQSRDYRHPQGDCAMGMGWEIALCIIFLFYYVCFIGLAISLRNVRPQYNEFRLIRNGGIFTVFLFMLSFITLHTKAYRESTGRCFLAIISAGAVSYNFWARNLEVLYNVLFNKEEYLVNFLAQMNSVPLTGQSGEPNPLESLFCHVRDEVVSAQVEVQELEHTLAKLQEQFKQEWSW